MRVKFQADADLVNVEPFGLNNPNKVLYPWNDPHGLIEAVFSR
jgi:hypothetical protein